MATTPAPAAAPAPAATPDATPQSVHRLIQQLGDNDYFVRQRAESELAKLGFDAFDALTEATSNDDLEIVARAKYLLRLLRVEWATAADPPEVKMLLRDYEAQNFEMRQTRLRSLAGLPGEVGVAALCRLARYEKSPLLSKLAALELLGGQKPDKLPNAAFIETVNKQLHGSRRAAAMWIATYARSGNGPQVLLKEWTELVNAETALLENNHSQTSAEIVAGLLRFQIARLKKTAQTAETVAAVRRLIQLEKGDPETLTGLILWLVDQKAWDAVDEAAKRFESVVGSSAPLLYALAEAQAAQGHHEQAEQTAARALALHSGPQPQEVAEHWMSAAHLRQRGQVAWAKQEYQHVIKVGTGNPNLVRTAQCHFADFLHDQVEDLTAAETLQQLVNDVGRDKPADTPVLEDHTLGEVRARMNFLFACHWEGKADAVKQRSYLKEALSDDADVDVLIACHRQSGWSPEQKRKVRHLIDKSTEDMREKIADEPDDASNYNQLAWLQANTGGDLDEALRDSLKSVELQPDTGGYYDTLGRVYFAKGDYANAVKFQSKAAELDPYSGLIRRQLELFRKKLDEKKGK